MIKNLPCDPNEVAIKSFFLGPAAENADWLQGVLGEIFENWYSWRRQINSADSSIISKNDQNIAEFLIQQNFTKEIIRDLVSRFESEIPKFSPRYMGHMFSEISMPALLGHFVTLLHNPNNISPEASRVGAEIEVQAIELLGQFVGYNKGIGHFTSGGTVANFEFLFRARERLATWLATCIAAGETDIMKSAHIGWEEFNSIKSRVSQSEIAKYFILNNSRDAYSQIQNKTGKTVGDPVLLVSGSKHYSWPKAMHYLGLGESNIRYIELDRFGRARPESLKSEIIRSIGRVEPILGVVGIVGTTEMGTIDPIDAFVDVLNDVKKNQGLSIWLHVDGAYGGFLGSLVNCTDTQQDCPESMRSSLSAMASSDSVTLDPHKLGYVPYSSGAFICQKEQDYFMRSFTGPYIVSQDRNLGNFTLEGSRSAAGAVATYASIKSFSAIDGYSKLLKRTINSKNELQSRLKQLNIKVFIPEGLDSNILCLVPLGNENRLTEVNKKTLRFYDQIQQSKEYWISKTTLSTAAFGSLISDFCSSQGVVKDTEKLELLRLTLMNPFTTSKESTVDHISAFCLLIEKEFTLLK